MGRRDVTRVSHTDGSLVVCGSERDVDRSNGRTDGTADRSRPPPSAVVGRPRGVARGARDEARASFARVSRCEGAEKVFRERIVASRALERRRCRAERRREGVVRRPISRARRGRIVREREISEEVFATGER